MLTQHWRISLPKDGKPVFLYTTTTDDAVSRDLQAEDKDSLICLARQYHRHPQTHEQNHRDLAIGALMAYATEPPFDRSRAQIARCEGVPGGSPSAFVGGGRRSDLLPIWEEAQEVEDEKEFS